MIRIAICLPLRIGFCHSTGAAYNAIVDGGTSSGIAAPYGRITYGKSVLLVTSKQHLGGLSSGGLGTTDSGQKLVIGDMACEFSSV